MTALARRSDGAAFARRAYQTRRRLITRSGGFSPASISAVSAWLRNTTTSGDISSVTDLLNNNPATQATAARRPAGLTDGSMEFVETVDNLVWSLIGANNGLDQTGYALWIEPDSVAVSGNIIVISVGAGGASARKLLVRHVTSRIMVQVFDPNAPGANGRQGQSDLGVIAAGRQFLTFEYDSTYATEAERVIVTVGGSPIALTFTDVGTPSGDITTLPSVTGNAIIANFQNTTAGSNPLTGRTSRNIFALGSRMSGATTGLLTTEGRSALMNFEALAA